MTAAASSSPSNQQKIVAIGAHNGVRNLFSPPIREIGW